MKHLIVAIVLGATLLACKTPEEPPDLPDVTVTQALPETPSPSSLEARRPLDEGDLQAVADYVAARLGAGDAGSAAARLAKMDERTGCDVQAFTSFRVPGDFADPAVQEEARASAAERDWQVAFGHSGDVWIAVAQNCTEDAFG